MGRGANPQNPARGRSGHRPMTKRPRRPRDANQQAKMIVDLATGAASRARLPGPPNMWNTALSRVHEDQTPSCLRRGKTRDWHLFDTTRHVASSYPWDHVCQVRNQTRKHIIGEPVVNFVIEQRWVTDDSRLHGEVIEISEQGTSGAVEILDDEGNRHTFRGTAVAFQLLPGCWRVVT
jgi:hypothetical protein